MAEREVFQASPDWRLLVGEAVDGLTRSRVSCVIARVYIWLSLVRPKFELGIKIKGAISY